MKIIIKNTKYMDGETNTVKNGTVYILNGLISDSFEPDAETKVINAGGNYVLPGLIDLHVHFRDPGQTYKEDIISGNSAAAAGGYTTVCCMPNTKPVIDSEEILTYTDKKGQDTDIVNLLIAPAMTMGQNGIEIVDFSGLVKVETRYSQMTGGRGGIFAITEDGKSLLDYDLMLHVCRKANVLGLMVMDHPEDTTGFTPGSPESEEGIVARDIELCRKTGCHIHLQHISTKNSLKLIQNAKKEGLNITCEATPHHFALNQDALDIFGTNAKMNPPLRTEEDRKAVVDGLRDKTIDIIATDHAPHSVEDKSVNFDKAPPGVTGLETGFPVSYTQLVKNGPFTLPDLVEIMSTKPAGLAGIERGTIEIGRVADLTVVDLDEPFVIDSKTFLSKGRNTPFDGMEVYGKILYTIKDGKVTYKNDR